MTDLPDDPCEGCGRRIIYSRGYYTIGPNHSSCWKYGKPSEWVVENCRFPEPWKPTIDKLEGDEARGWLSPDGDFYECSYMVHIRMGYALAEHFYGLRRGYSDLEDMAEESRKTDKDLEAHKWIHISPDGFWLGGGYDASRWDRYEDTSQKQLDALFDWFLTLEPTEEWGRAYKDLKFFFEELKRRGED